jgi:hypothetical protein
MAKKSVDPLKAKQRKQKIVAAVLGVVFVGLLVFQVPRVMKRLHPSSAPPPPASTTTTPTATPTLAAPTLSGGEPSGSTAGSGSLTASSVPAVQDGQLASFSLFASKDPFAQQLSDAKTSSSTSSPSSPKGSSSASGTASGTGSGSRSAAPGATSPAPGSAVISVNGTLYSVAVRTDFPQASTTDPSIVPLFHLISLTAHSAKISIVGGSYANGAPAVTLTENKPVTLMNTADGTRYKLILKPVGTAVTAAAAPTSTTSTTVTVPPPASP